MRRHRTGRGDWLHEAHREHGARILAEGWSQRQTALALDMSERKARRLWEYTHDTAGPRRPQRIEGAMHLVVGDIHLGAAGDVTPERMTWLGRMIVDLQPTVVVQIGDAADMPSLSNYDRGKRSFEGRRYVRDVEACREGLRLLHREIDGRWSGRLVWCVGNHEARITRAIDDAAHLDGVIGLDDLGFGERGWEVAPFLSPIEIDGVHYCHYIHGRSPHALGGIHHARNLLQRRMRSHTVGHSHTYQHREFRQVGVHLSGLVCGCYHLHDDDYARQSNEEYWRGVVVCHDVIGGTYDIEQYSMRRIRERWGYE